MLGERQIGREIEGQRDKETKRQNTERETDRHRGGKTERQRDRQTEDRDRETERKGDREKRTRETERKRDREEEREGEIVYHYSARAPGVRVNLLSAHQFWFTGTLAGGLFMYSQ
jgi:hypothetical protein